MNRVCAAELAFLAWTFAGSLLFAPVGQAQDASPRGDSPQRTADARKPSVQDTGIRDYNGLTSATTPTDERAAASAEYRIGTNDLLEISVFDVPELSRKVRVAASGEISFPLIGGVQAGGLTAQELEVVLQSRLRKYMKDPHVGILVNTVESHPISVLGAVHKPGVFQVRGPKSLLEMLSMAEGLADDAGDSVLVMRGAGLRSIETGDANVTQSGASNLNGPLSTDANATAGNSASPAERAVDGQTIQVNLKNLLQSEDARFNVTVYPGDIVKVVRAGLIYVVGDVKKPGGFVLKGNEPMTVLKAVALAEGFTNTSRKSRAKIIRPSSIAGQNQEIPINLGKILAGKAPDPTLMAADVVFVPNSSGKTLAYRGSEVAVSTLIGLFIWHW